MAPVVAFGSKMSVSYTFGPPTCFHNLPEIFPSMYRETPCKCDGQRPSHYLSPWELANKQKELASSLERFEKRWVSTCTMLYYSFRGGGAFQTRIFGDWLIQQYYEWKSVAIKIIAMAIVLLFTSMNDCWCVLLFVFFLFILFYLMILFV